MTDAETPMTLDQFEKKANEIYARYVKAIIESSTTFSNEIEELLKSIADLPSNTKKSAMAIISICEKQMIVDVEKATN